MPKKPAKSRSYGGDVEVSFGVYINEIKRIKLLSAEEEKALARRIALERTEHWIALLSYTPFLTAFIDATQQALLDKKQEIPPEFEAVRALHNLPRGVSRRGLRSARQNLGRALSTADFDGSLAELLFANTLAVQRGQWEAVTIPRLPPAAASPRFQEHVRNVERTLATLKRTKHKFVKANLRLVVTVAMRFDHGLMPFQDLVQEGNIGLMKAVDRFDWQRGYRFSTYATWWIRHEISRGLTNKARTVRLPAHVCADATRLRRIARELELESGDDITPTQLAAAAGMKVSRVVNLSEICLDRTVSLNAPIYGADGGDTLVTRLEDPGLHALDLLLSDGDERSLHAAMTHLSALEFEILSRRYGVVNPGLDNNSEPETLREIGASHNLSRERIRQIQQSALEKLRRHYRRLTA